MRIALVGPIWHAGWASSVRDALQRLGHTTAFVLEYAEPRGRYTFLPYLPTKLRNPVQGPLHRARAQAQQIANAAFGRRLAAHVERTHPDLVILLKGSVVSPATIVSIRRQYAPIACWWIDDPFEFPAAIEMARCCDRFFVYSRRLVDRLQQVGVAGACFLPCAYDPRVYRMVALSDEDRRQYSSDIAFVGTYYRRRDDMMDSLAGLPLAIWGPGWVEAAALGNLRVPKSAIRGHGLRPWQVARALNATRISINVHNLQSFEGGVNMRTFEAAACGAFQLVDSVPDIEELFVPGEEVVLYRDRAELRRLAIYYLEHPDDAAKIAERARVRAVRDHTFERRITALLEQML